MMTLIGVSYVQTKDGNAFLSNTLQYKCIEPFNEACRIKAIAYRQSQLHLTLFASYIFKRNYQKELWTMEDENLCIICRASYLNGVVTADFVHQRL